MAFLRVLHCCRPSMQIFPVSAFCNIAMFCLLTSLPTCVTSSKQQQSEVNELHKVQTPSTLNLESLQMTLNQMLLTQTIMRPLRGIPAFE